MSVVEAAAPGWGRDHHHRRHLLFDRPWKGMENVGADDIGMGMDMDVLLPSTPLLKPINLAAPSPPPLALPPAMRSNLSPMTRISSCGPSSASSSRNPRSPLAELKNDSNRCCSSPDSDTASPSLMIRSRTGTLGTGMKKIKGTLSPGSSRAAKSSKRSMGVDDENAAAKENNEAEMVAVSIASPFKRKRPPKLQIPIESDHGSGVKHRDADQHQAPMDISAEGKSFGLCSKKGGHRQVLEDAYQAVPDIDGNSRQAFFGIFDGHGGRVAAEFAADHLSRNIRDALGDGGGRDLEAAVRVGYLATDAAFLEKRVSSGASCVTAFIRDSSLVVANAGDCRAVLSRNGVAVALTNDHRLAREDERRRVEDLGGYVDLYSGVWRLQGVLAVSRGIGDMHLKEWVSAEPEIQKLKIDQDCEFLVMASDGLWDVVSNQEAVDCVGTGGSGAAAAGLAASAKKLAELAASRGSRDDISVMVVNLRHFC